MLLEEEAFEALVISKIKEALQREAQASKDIENVKTLIPELPDVRQQAQMRRQAEILGMKNFLTLAIA